MTLPTQPRTARYPLASSRMSAQQPVQNPAEIELDRRLVTVADRESILTSVKFPLSMGARILGDGIRFGVARQKLVREVTANQAMLRLGTRFSHHFVVGSFTEELMPQVDAVLSEILGQKSEPIEAERETAKKPAFDIPRVFAGQVWEDNDPRRKGRLVRVLHDSSPYATGESKVRCETVNGEGAGRHVTIRLDRFRSISKGYILRKDVPAHKASLAAA